MRESLAPLEGRRLTVQATFERYGSKKAYRGPPIVTLLLTGVTNAQGHPLCDHVWLVEGKLLKAFNGLQHGSRLEFSALVKRYRKGYRGRREDDWSEGPSEDFKLAWPTNFRLLSAPCYVTQKDREKPLACKPLVLFTEKQLALFLD